MTTRGKLALLLLASLAACRKPEGPSPEVVKKAAESQFERAARGEDVPAIHFTGQGTGIPKLISSDIRARRRSGEAFEYEVRLTYLNRIQQMEWVTVTVRFERRGEGWEASFPESQP